MAGEKGIKEIMEVLDAVQLIGVGAKQVLKDGKVGLDDLPVAMALVAQANVIVEAVKDAALVLEEGKELSEEEAAQLIAKLYAVARAVQAA